jgi:tryptophan-rich sensory protein
MTGGSSALVALLICAAAAALEGALAGRGIRARFGELCLPRFSPSLSVWFLIGSAYYIICFIVLYRLLTAHLASSTHRAAFILLLVFMAANAGWGWLFFRRKNLRASFLAFFPYGFLTLALVLVLTRIDSTSAVLLASYLAYLGYALWWAHRVWVLNRAQ